MNLLKTFSGTFEKTVEGTISGIEGYGKLTTFRMVQQ